MSRTTLCLSLILTCCSSVATNAPAFGQTADPPPTATSQARDDKPRRLTFGVRIRAFPFGSLNNNHFETTTSTPVTDSIFTTTTTGSKLGVGPVVEYSLGSRFSVGGEFLYQRIRYQKVSELFQGTDNTSTTADERTKTTLTENTKASQWDLPILLRYNPMFDGRIASRVYFLGGVAFRNISSIRTGTESVYAVPNKDAVNSYNEIRASPAHRNALGGVFGAGLRYIDDFKLNWTPEVRYTYWNAAIFGGEASPSRRGQLDVSVGITF